jgi:hypothetical protein
MSLMASPSCISKSDAGKTVVVLKSNVLGLVASFGYLLTDGGEE